jgi:hypothetical protein
MIRSIEGMWRQLDDRRTAGCCSSAAWHSLHGMYTRAPIDRPISAVRAWTGARDRTTTIALLRADGSEAPASSFNVKDHVASARRTYVRTYLLLIGAHVRARACGLPSFFVSTHTGWLELERTKSPFPREQAYMEGMDKRKRYASVRTSVYIYISARTWR